MQEKIISFHALIASAQLGFLILDNAFLISNLLGFILINDGIIPHDLQHLIFLPHQNLCVWFCFLLFATLFSLANFQLGAKMYGQLEQV